MSGRLGAGVRTIQLSSESPLTFPMANPNLGISDAIDAAIHTDLPAHPYSGMRRLSFFVGLSGCTIDFEPFSCRPANLEVFKQVASQSELA